MFRADSILNWHLAKDAISDVCWKTEQAVNIAMINIKDAFVALLIILNLNYKFIDLLTT
jgi:hypothetical protein